MEWGYFSQWLISIPNEHRSEPQAAEWQSAVAIFIPFPTHTLPIIMTRILVAYATKHGSTTGIAEAIGRELTAAGLSVEVKELKNVQSPAGYDAVIIGGPIYIGKVMADVKKFVGRHREKLAAMPVAAFVVGLSPASKDEEEIGAARKALSDAVAPLQPVASALFAGSVDPEKLGFIERKMIGIVKSPTGDFRDWEAITAWAKELPPLLAKG